MKIGYAQNTITPSLDKSVFMAGFGNNRGAEKILINCMLARFRFKLIKPHAMTLCCA